MSAAPRPGVTVFLTGLSGAGKSTIADALVADLEREGRPVTVLDGDVVRTHLSSELGFDKEHRDLNIRRIGWVAGEVVKHGGTVVVAAIAPYEEAREQARTLVEEHGRFVLVHLSTPLEVCEERDVKGLYAKARSGEIPVFTGVSDPYEPPVAPELVIDTSVTPLAESVARIRAAMVEGPRPAHPSQARGGARDGAALQEGRPSCRIAVGLPLGRGG
jgi:adenylyl-sulfate kinase